MPKCMELLKERNKEKILKAVRGKEHSTEHSKNTKKNTVRITANLLSETMQARRQWNAIFKVLIENTCEPRIL